VGRIIPASFRPFTQQRVITPQPRNHRMGASKARTESTKHLGISLRTVEAQWTHVRARLRRYLSGTPA